MSAGSLHPRRRRSDPRRAVCRRGAGSSVRRRTAGNGAGHGRRQRPRPRHWNRQQQGRAVAIFGAYADEARKLYDPQGDQTLDELKQQVFADKTAGRAGAASCRRDGASRPTGLALPLLLRGRSSERGTVEGHAAWLRDPLRVRHPWRRYVGDKVTERRQGDGQNSPAPTGSAFAKTGNPNGAGRPEWPRHDPAPNRMINFTNAGRCCRA